ncbi:hypothetical protein [Methanosarcina sp. UBA289]|uniref:hypothetical protein n=1 Tax=Methanosarcina sp. UBA289 TaxID=1915574 RepID=UPI0025D0478B|nr:hypothetical protein [Methanosarcina sp. UBA289]
MSDDIRYYALIILFALGMFAIDDFRGITRTCYDGADGHEIVLHNNKTAVDPTFEQVKAFAREDLTNTKKYTSKYQCGDFSEEFHDNAEAAGYKCGWVFVDLENGPEDHACNVFNTTDAGLVFIDCTHGDSRVRVAKGEEYKPKHYESLGFVSNYNILW